MVSKLYRNMNQSVWELERELDRNADDFERRKDFLKFFHQSRLYLEKKRKVPPDDRSFLLLQENKSSCCLLLHGAGGSPGEMRLLGDYLYSLGYTVYSNNMPLQTRAANESIGKVLVDQLGWVGNRKKNGGVAVAESKWGICLAESEMTLEVLLKYSSNVYIFGFSFGGTVALNLMENYPVRGSVLIAPALYPVRTGRYLLFKSLKTVLPGVARGLAPAEYAVIDMMDWTKRRLGIIDKPVMVIQAEDDRVVSSKGFKRLKKYSTNSNSRFVMLEGGGHVLVSGENCDAVFDLGEEFLKTI
jgi:esterase/lipase